MPIYRVDGMLMHMKLGKSKRHPPPAPCCCVINQAGKRTRCLAISIYLCDWELLEGGTCDAPLCAEHVQEVGPDRHLCPAHAAQRETA